MDQSETRKLRLGLRILRSGCMGVVLPCWMVLAILMGSFGSVAAAEPAQVVSADAIISASTPAAVVFILSVLILKLMAFVLGYLIVKLGHDTLVKGVTGQIDFGFSGSGFKTKLKAASPGTFFVLMGAAIIIWGLTVQKPMDIKVMPASSPPTITEPSKGAEIQHRPEVPD